MFKLIFTKMQIIKKNIFLSIYILNQLLSMFFYKKYKFINIYN